LHPGILRYGTALQTTFPVEERDEIEARTQILRKKGGICRMMEKESAILNAPAAASDQAIKKG
jgi:hypothetical protein